MITVVNENVVSSNPYPGLNLAEACGQFALEMEQIMNEAQMDILLAEHAYLYENGVEVVYEAENGEANENGKAFKAKVLETIKALGKKIAEIWDKLVQWCKDRFNEFKAWFKKIGITKAHTDKASMLLGSVEVKLSKSSNMKGVDFEQFKKDYASFFGHDENSAWVAGKAWKDTDYYYDYKVDTITKGWFDDCVNVVFDGEKDVLADIKKKKADALERIKALEEMVKMKKEANSSETMKALKQASKEQTAVATNCSRVYYKYVNECASIVRLVLANKDIKKGISELNAADKSLKKMDKADGKIRFGKRNDQ